MWGGLSPSRADAGAKAASGLARPGPPWSFASSRSHFTAANAVSTFPIVGSAQLLMELPDPNWLSGYAWFRADAAPKLYVTAAYGTVQNDTQAQLFFQRADMPSFDEYHVATFFVVADAAFHTYTVDLSQVDGYNGTIVAIRFDPVVAGVRLTSPPPPPPAPLP